ncbi:MAG TPA: DUF2996 domain-containing protein [Candidatus Caenarcaniphilales bacterium]
MAEEMTSNTGDAGAKTEEARNAAAGKGPNSAGGNAPSTAEEHVPGTDEAQATDLPTQDAPDPKANRSKVDANAAGEKKSGTTAPKQAAAQGTVAKAAAKKPKKEAASGIEDKPFADFIHQDYLPTLQKAFAVEGIQDLKLTFDNNQVTGRWNPGGREFTVYFPDSDIQGRKAFSCTLDGIEPSTIEPFLIDERKATLDLLIFGVFQRLNAQKWLGYN